MLYERANWQFHYLEIGWDNMVKKWNFVHHSMKRIRGIVHCASHEIWIRHALLNNELQLFSNRVTSLQQPKQQQQHRHNIQKRLNDSEWRIEFSDKQRQRNRNNNYIVVRLCSTRKMLFVIKCRKSSNGLVCVRCAFSSIYLWIFAYENVGMSTNLPFVSFLLLWTLKNWHGLSLNSLCIWNLRWKFEEASNDARYHICDALHFDWLLVWAQAFRWDVNNTFPSKYQARSK